MLRVKMKVVILAGGLGTRISEESHLRPKPMIEIGGKPIIWHIMKIFGSYGFNDFIICCGYKGYVIKEYFSNYFLHMSDITIDLSNNTTVLHHKHAEPWKITLVDTGDDSGTGGRIKRIAEYLDGTFFLTYGDGLSDININNLLQHHKNSGKMATITAIQPVSRFGTLEIENTLVKSFVEKPADTGQWVSGGFFVCETSVLDKIQSDYDVWEHDPLQRIVKDKQLSVFQHNGFWSAMDTLRDKVNLEKLWNTGDAPWKNWN